MITVWKFTLDLRSGDAHAVEMPAGAELLHVDSPSGQPEIVNVWARLNSEAPKVNRRLAVTGTGAGRARRRVHVGSVVTDSGLVWHVWDFGEQS